MKLRLLSFLCISLLLGLHGHGQATKKVKENHKNHPITKKYAVLKSDLSAKHGPYKELFRLNTFTTGSYENGLKSGAWKYFNADEMLEISAFYQNGKRDSVWTYFYSTGKIRCTIYYNNGIPDSVIAYHENGKVSYEHKLDSYGNGRAKSFYAGGNLKQMLSLKGYELSGECSVYFEHGQLHRRTDFKDGLPWTVHETFDENGNPFDGGDIVNGSGSYVMFFSQGMDDNKFYISSYWSYKNGELDGWYESYKEPGVLRQTGFYENNFKVGDWVTYKGLDESIEHFTPNQQIQNDVKDEADPQKTHYQYYTGRTSNMSYPKYQEGTDGLMAFLGENIVYPYSAGMAGIRGYVYVAFSVDIEGNTRNPEVIHSPHKQLSDEALRVVKTIPRWRPGYGDNVPIEGKFHLPINFRRN